MKLFPRSYRTLSASFAALAVIGVSGCGLRSDLPSETWSFDKLNIELANRVRDQMLPPGTVHADLIIGITRRADPVGTLYRPDGSFRVFDGESCVEGVPAGSEAFYFPSNVKLSNGTIGSLGLDQALSSLANFGIKVDFSQGVELAFSDVSQVELDDRQVQNRISLNETCKAVVDGKPFYFVRGYVILKRDFSLASTNEISIDIGAEKVGALTVSPIKNSKEVKVADEQAKPFIQILQIINGGVHQSASNPRRGFLGLQNLSSSSQPALTYIQISSSDTSGNGLKIQQALRNKKISVANAIESLQDSQMPDSTEVRYYRERDLRKAQKVLTVVKSFQPNASLVRLGLPAKPGLIEVWIRQ
jgi:hypothetical protein